MDDTAANLVFVRPNICKPLSFYTFWNTLTVTLPLLFVCDPDRQIYKPLRVYTFGEVYPPQVD